jgi:hypothetical protein
MKRLFSVLMVLGLATAWTCADPVFSPAGFTSPIVIDYFNSPLGVLPGGTAITSQYASLGVVHNGHTTTPPGPPGMSSLSGLPGLEAGSGGPLGLTIRVDFSILVRQIGAFYLMGDANDSITLRAFNAANVLIEAVTVAPGSMPLHPGPFGFNEGFVGLFTSQAIAYATFNPTSSPYVIDDLHFSTVPEPTSLALMGCGVSFLVLWRWRSRPARRSSGLSQAAR